MNAASRIVAAALVLSATSACATSPAAPAGDAVEGSIEFADLPLTPPVRTMALTVYPTPFRSEYGDVLLPLEGAVVVDETSPDFDARVRGTGLELAWKDLPREGYLISVTGEAGHTLVVSASRDDAGRKWAAQALAQVTWETPQGKFVRVCRVLDAPVFPLRGSKRPLAWETRYRANFSWGTRDDADSRGRTMTCVYAPGIPLDASGEGVARALEYFRPWQDRGVRLFAIKFDDESFGLTSDTALRHGAFAPAFVSFLRLVRQGLRRRDSDARLYLLPQTYWWDDPRLPPFAASLRLAGGFDEDVGLVFTGPEVISTKIDAPGLAAARRAFGLTETKALVYDNLGREGDWGPLTGRDPALWRVADGVFGERGTPVNRLTRLDWLWNPESYDPERSWRRAIFELAGPQGYESFLAVCRAFRDGWSRERTAALVDAFAAAPENPFRGPIARKDLLALVRGDCGRLSASSTTAKSP